MKPLIIVALAGITAFGILLNSCQHEPEDTGNPAICFDKTILPIISSSCATKDCHGGSGEAPPLLGFSDVSRFVTAYKPMASKLHKVMVGHPKMPNFMPPSNSPYKITGKQIDLINLWILQGAKYDPNCNICEQTVTFSGTIQPIIVTSCLSCHSGPNAAKGILLVDYTTIRYAVDSLHLQDAVNIDNKGQVPMPYNSDHLSNCNIDQINTWITDSIPNN